MSESYFFTICPKHLKLDHSFAKNIKPETKYKLAIFKGIQKCDQMKQQLRSKIVNGKIQFPSTQLHFNIAYFNPTKNIQFHVKLYQQKPNEQQKQIGSYIILSSDYIKQFKNQAKSQFQVSGMLLSDLFIDFDLFVSKSKSSLIEIIRKYWSQSVINKQRLNQDDDSKSQKSQLSRQFVRNGNGFISPKRKIERKKSPQIRPASRAKSINKSEKSFTNRPLSPRKSQKSNNQSRQQSKISTQQATYQNQPSEKLKFKNTSSIFDIQIQNKVSPLKSPKNLENKKVKSIQTTQQSKPFKIQVKTSPRAYQITKSPVSKSPDSRDIKSPGKFQPKRQPKIEIIDDAEKQATFFPQIKISVSQSNVPKTSLLSTQNISNSKKDILKSGVNLLSSDQHFKMQQSNIRIVMEQSFTNYSAPRIIGDSEQPLTLQIEEKTNQPEFFKILEDSKSDFIKTGHWTRSIRSTELVRSQLHQEQQKIKDKTAQQRKKQIIYAIFLLISAFLIYNAMTPTRRT